MRVLVADDDLVSRLMLQAAVEGLGHECLVARDGTRAWALYVEHGPDVLITDQMMPGVDGLELCRRIRDHQGSSYTYIVLATSLAGRADVLAGMEAGADDYLTKPLDPFDLETRLVAARRVTALHAELDRYRRDLAHLACTDPLTQLRNRLSLDGDLAAIHARSQRHGRPYAVAMCDVDHFKSYNDTLGHQAGDQALHAVAAALTAQLRQGDVVYRYGGEEFLVIMPDQDLAAGTTAAERLRRAVEDLGLAHPASPTAGVVTVSIGVAASTGVGQAGVELLKASDDALYRAKSAGRNRVRASQGAHDVTELVPDARLPARR